MRCLTCESPSRYWRNLTYICGQAVECRDAWHDADGELYGVPAYVDDRVPRRWNGGVGMIVPEGADPEAMLEALSGSQPRPA